MVPRRCTESEFWRLYFVHAHAAVTKVAKSLAPAPLSKKLLQQGDDVTSNSIIAAFKEDATFLAFSDKETKAIVARDAEDDEKLAAGIRMAVEKGVIPANPPVEPTYELDVYGKPADMVAAEIVRKLGDAPSKGCVLVLQVRLGPASASPPRCLPARPHRTAPHAQHPLAARPLGRPRPPHRRACRALARARPSPSCARSSRRR